MFIDANKAATVFGRDDIESYIERQIKEKNLVRIKKAPISVNGTALIAGGYGKDASSDDNVTSTTNNVKSSERVDFGYHAGDLGKAEPLSIIGGRGTGHFGTGTPE